MWCNLRSNWRMVVAIFGDSGRKYNSGYRLGTITTMKGDEGQKCNSGYNLRTIAIIKQKKND